MKKIQIIIVALCFTAISCSKENIKKSSSSVNFKSDTKIGFYAQIEGLPGVTEFKVESSAKEVNCRTSRSSSCDGVCNNSQRSYSVYISPMVYGEYSINIKLHKENAKVTPEFYEMTGEIPFKEYWFQDPVKLGTPEINGAEITFYHKSTGMSYYTDIDFVNYVSKNEKLVNNNKLAGSSFIMTKINANTFEGKVNCTLRAADNSKIVLKNAEFRANL